MPRSKVRPARKTSARDWYANIATRDNDSPIDDGPGDGEYDDGFDNSSGEMDAGNSAGQAKKGFFYFNTDVPQGAVITEAYLLLTSASNASGVTVNLLIDAADEDNPEVPHGVADALARPRTTAQVAWNDVGAWVASTVYQSPSIVAVIQELVDRLGFIGPVLIFVEDNGSTVTAGRKIKTYNGTPAEAAVLHIVYSRVPPPVPTPGSGRLDFSKSKNSTYLGGT